MRTIPFDLAKAKTPDNPDGLDVVDGLGRSVRIVYTEAKGSFPIIAIIEDDYEIEGAATYTIDGLATFSNVERDKDYNLLLLAPEPKVREVWGILYQDIRPGLWLAYSFTYPTQEEAWAYAEAHKRSLKKKLQIDNPQIRVVKFYEYTEGEQQ